MVVAEYLSQSPPSDGNRQLLDVPLTRGAPVYAIHDSELAVWKEAVAAASGLALMVPNPVALIGGVVLALYRYYRKRVAVTAGQVLILRELRRFGSKGATELELFNAIGVVAEARPPLREELRALEIAVAVDGTEAKFIRRVGDRIWAVDV
jgi:hypothetical protein